VVKSIGSETVPFEPYDESSLKQQQLEDAPQKEETGSISCLSAEELKAIEEEKIAREKELEELASQITSSTKKRASEIRLSRNIEVVKSIGSETVPFEPYEEGGLN